MNDLELRLMTYNVRYFGQPSKGLSSTDRAARGIAEAIAALDPPPDLIALQEVEAQSLRAGWLRPSAKDTHQLDAFVVELHQALDALGLPQRYQARYYPSHTYRLEAKAALYTTGLALLISEDFAIDDACSQPVEDVTHRRLRMTRGLKQTRICVHQSLRHIATGAQLDLFNTHLSLPQFLSWSSLAFTKQLGYGANQLIELFSVLDYVERARTSPHYVLMGDFNALPGSPVYQQVLDSGLFYDPLCQHCAFAAQDYRRFPSAGFMRFKMHLDYVFSSPSLAWIDFDATQAYGKEGPFKGLSDHNPIIGRLRLPLQVVAPYDAPETFSPATLPAFTSSLGDHPL